MDENLARLEEIFTEALGKSVPEERVEYLASACGGNAELRRRVEALLAAHEVQDDFLKIPGETGAAEGATILREGAGTVIGRYKLLEQIGEGGFGVVFMAEQTEPVRRKVALKIIKLGMDTKQVVARFEAERQALAMMDHPNIAKVLEAGATETGRPYFVMELVNGVSITRFCNQEKLSTRERLELFMQVCGAVQHAHQKGIIHRDLKPNNVLVTMHDEKPVPMIIDFGIAKATQNPQTERTALTEFRQLMGTPAYMSPEQAQMSGQEVDTRSDIYSLGVLLYELLTGSTPLDVKEHSLRPFDEIQRMICDLVPAAPSTRIANMEHGQLSIVAGLCQCEPKTLVCILRGELDWIVMKALEKERGRRYDSVGDFQSDIRRYLADEVVLARPASAFYKASKVVRRHKATFAAGILLVTAIILGFVGTSVGLMRARVALSAANEQRNRAIAAERLAKERQYLAQREMAIARAVATFQDDMLRSANRQLTQDSDHVTVMQVVETTIKRLEAGDLKSQPLVEAAARSNLGRILFSLGEDDESKEVLYKSLDLVRKANLADGRSSEDANLIWPLKNLVDLLDNAGLRTEEEPLAKELYDLASKAQMNPWEAGTCMSYYGRCLAQQNRSDQAYEPLVGAFHAFEQSGMVEQIESGRWRQTKEWHEEAIMLILIVDDLCDVCQLVGRPDEARQYWVHLAKLTGAEPLRPEEPLPRPKRATRPLSPTTTGPH